MPQNTTGHTLGPWSVVAHAPDLVRSARFQPVADARCGPGNDSEREANARLIAAAPDMLTALRAVATVIGDLGQINKGGLTHQRVLDALSKAEAR